LVAFATTTHLARFYSDLIGESEGAFKAYIEATRLQMSLATKLRLTPQSRTDPKTIGRHASPMERDWRLPWESQQEFEARVGNEITKDPRQAPARF
jgi:hypothetical protein